MTYAGENPISTSDQKLLRSHLGHGITLMLQNARSALNPFMNMEDQIGRALSNRGVDKEQAKRNLF